MLKAAPVSIRMVLDQRRAQLAIRLAANLALTSICGPLVGWTWMLVFSASYIAVQCVEVLSLSGEKPWVSEDGRHGRNIALAILSLNSLIFGAPTLLLTRHLGSWGDASAGYLLCGTILNAALTTIGCRPAFRAIVFPYFFYIGVLPFSTLDEVDRPSTIVMWSLICCGFFLILNVWFLWIKCSEGIAAKILEDQRSRGERDEHEQKLFRITQLDALTGLWNRDVLQARMTQISDAGEVCTLLMIDLDGFKYVNDTLGHSAGDRILCAIADRIENVAGGAYIAARLGGDEFALLLPGIAEPAMATEIADQLIAEVSKPVTLDGHQINIGASVGIVFHPVHGAHAEVLFANGDLALYQAKAEGRHCSRLYHPDLRVIAESKVLRDSEMSLALARGEFEIYYQPLIRLTDGRLEGAEALLRWRHPALGVLKPADFLTALDGGLLSAHVGAWAIETACRQAASWRQHGVPDFKISVNLFGAQFRSGNLVTWVMEACANAGLPADGLEIEITENMILRHEDDMIGPLQELRAQGVGIALDDYGTGFASLNMLTRLPVSRLKLDQCFTKTICGTPHEAAIVHAVIDLAQALQLKVTAEGVETQAQADALLRDGCDEGQGYHFGAPMNAADFSLVFELGPALKPAGFCALA